MHRFFQVTLRTFDVAAARDFYATLFPDRALDIVPLHEQAIARGARPHWIGYIEVDDVAEKSAAFFERGAQALAPKWVNPDGLEAQVMRDPGGAILAIARPSAEARARAFGPDVLAYVLNTEDVERARANYAELFGWQFDAPEQLSALGTIHPFSFAAGEARAGSMHDIAGRPEVHPHWLFNFAVPALEPAIAIVQARGGKVLDPISLADGTRVAVCDDPQGAAFALRMLARR